MRSRREGQFAGEGSSWYGDAEQGSLTTVLERTLATAKMEIEGRAIRVLTRRE